MKAFYISIIVLLCSFEQYTVCTRKHIKSYRAPDDALLCMNQTSTQANTIVPHTVPTGFGKTHFVVGWPSERTFVPPSNDVSTTSCPKHLSDVICAEDGCVKQAYFSPDDNVQQLMVSLIGEEKKSISIAIFSFTHLEIAQALIAAHKRGVTVTIIVDPSCVADRFNKLGLLQKAGIEIRVYKQQKKHGVLIDKMHHKFVLFADNIKGKHIIVTGSFNFTKSAATVNQENIVILEDKRIVRRFVNQFDQLYKRSTKLNNISA